MIYNGEHSITFDQKINTWNDWHLIPSSRPSVNPPSIKTRYIDTSLKNGLIDQTEIFEERVVNYGQMEGTFEFIIDNEMGPYFAQAMYFKIMEYLHGKVHEIYLDDDPYTIYTGRFYVSSFDPSEGHYSKIVIGYNLSIK